VVIGLFAWRLNVNHRYHPLVMISAFKRRRHAKRSPGVAREEARAE
jgi:lipopolysaccharide export system permease protein